MKSWVSLVLLRNRADDDHALASRFILELVFFAGEYQSKIAFFDLSFFTAFRDYGTTTFNYIVQMFVGVFMKGSVAAGLESKYAKGE